MAAKSSFMYFLSTTDYEGREDLFHMFNRKIDLAKTIGLAWNDYTGTIEYMEQHLSEFCITFPGEDIRWVPCNLLKYINNKEGAFCKRLERFEDTAAVGDQLKVLTDDEVLAFEKGPLGNHFLSWVACFVFLISECESDDEVESEALALGGFANKEPKELPQDRTTEQQESTWGTTSFPQGLEKMAASPPRDLGPSSSGPLPEHDLLTLSTVVIDDEEFFYLHDLEKLCKLRLDECFSIITTNSEIPLDSAVPNTLDEKCIPQSFGEDLVDVVVLVQEDIRQAEQAKVAPEEFAEVQADLLARQAPVRDEVTGEREDAGPTILEGASSINLEKYTNDDEVRKKIIMLSINNVVV